MIQYDPHQWIDHFFDLKGSMFREIIGRVFLCVLWSAAVVTFHLKVYPVDISPLVHSLLGVAMSLLLVFRTNASYDRFWEGRKAWGGIVNETRNLVRLSLATLSSHPLIVRRIIHLTIAFPYAVMNRLRGPQSQPHLPTLSDEENNRLLTSDPHPAFGISIQLSYILNECRKEDLISDYLQVAIDQNVQLLVDYLGICERIHSTPLPFAYVVHLRRALVIYCFSLPFALIDSFGWISVLVTFLVSYIFFGIEEIGVEIEDPFGVDENDLPLELICQKIEQNLVLSIPKT